MLKLKQLVVGPFQCNCSIVIDDNTREAIVIDAGDEFAKIQKFLQAENITVKYSIHTHAHLDHIGAAAPLKAWSPQTQIALHKDDVALYHQLPMQGRLFGFEYAPPPPVDIELVDTQEIEFAGCKCSVIHTPGHSPGGICLHFREGLLAPEPVLFTGDTLFQRSIGRTDLWGGDHDLLISSIKDRILTLDDQTKVLPGHGPSSAVGIESRENPFL